LEKRLLGGKRFFDHFFGVPGRALGIFLIGII
jgi:hypothetical protein